jgi:hypothetical protein
MRIILKTEMILAAGVILTFLVGDLSSQQGSVGKEKPMEEVQVLQWSREIPLTDPIRQRANPNFSFEEWLARGRKLPGVVDTLIKLLDGEDLQRPSGDGLRLAYALGSLGERRRPAVNALVRSLGSKDVELRSGAAIALGSIGDASVVHLLENLVKDRRENKYVRGNACVSIGRLGVRSGEPVLREALKDPEPFVVLCAEEGLKLIHPGPEGPR